MPREKKCPPSGPNMGYLVSFGDTMTALLAFFIVLNSLAEEQTGANLHSGTGSFVKALHSFGVPGIFSSKLSAQAFQLEAPAPLYIVGADELDDSPLNSTGVDEDDDRQRIIDREQEDFQRFLHEVDRWHDVSAQESVDGEVAFDLFAKLGPNGTAPPELLSAARQISQMLRQDGYEAEVIVWATTPSLTAWPRAIEQAHNLQRELADYLRLDESSNKLTSSGRPWNSDSAKRPTVSLVLRRLE
ncbi:MAG: flagellar motor protein MotB [Planctomycetaceae bacterium]|nr:flagellar motor protein MotB [Planctomycetaceae bacterium]